MVFTQTCAFIKAWNNFFFKHLKRCKCSEMQALWYYRFHSREFRIIWRWHVIKRNQFNMYIIHPHLQNHMTHKWPKNYSNAIDAKEVIFAFLSCVCVGIFALTCWHLKVVMRQTNESLLNLVYIQWNVNRNKFLLDIKRKQK